MYTALDIKLFLFPILARDRCKARYVLSPVRLSVRLFVTLYVCHAGRSVNNGRRQDSLYSGRITVVFVE